MEKSRVEFLQETLRQNPGDGFSCYGLALEVSRSAPAEAVPI
jgi:hypothetical protein